MHALENAERSAGLGIHVVRHRLAHSSVMQVRVVVQQNGCKNVHLDKEFEIPAMTIQKSYVNKFGAHTAAEDTRAKTRGIDIANNKKPHGGVEEESNSEPENIETSCFEAPIKTGLEHVPEEKSK